MSFTIWSSASFLPSQSRRACPSTFCCRCRRGPTIEIIAFSTARRANDIRDGGRFLSLDGKLSLTKYYCFAGTSDIQGLFNHYSICASNFIALNWKQLTQFVISANLSYSIPTYILYLKVPVSTIFWILLLNF